MFRTLRSQLIISHILPSLIIIPIMGFALVYFLENRIIIPNLKNLLTDDAVVIAKVLRSQPQMFTDTQLASSTLENIELETATRVMILDPYGRLIVSSDPGDADRESQILNSRGIAEAEAGSITSHVDFSAGMHGNIVDVFAPVTGVDGELLGILRVSYRFTTIAEQFISLRYLILAVVAFGAVSSAVVGFLLALNIDRPVQEVTQAIFDLATGARADKLPEAGPREIKVLQGAANFLVERLHELEASRRQLLANLIHELGRPLGGLRVGIQVLRAGAKEDPQVLDELLEGLETETTILRRLLEDLSHLYDQLLGILELDIQRVALSEWLPVVLVSAQRRARTKGLQWHEDIPDHLPTLEIDPLRMAQVIGNLTANAIKYTPKGGLVTIAAGKKGDQVWIRVSDTGPGIPIEEQDKIFDPFFRGEHEKRIKQGMGLGLSIARDLVVAHRGRLELESTPGSGSRFTIWLPETKQLSDFVEADAQGNPK